MENATRTAEYLLVQLKSPQLGFIFDIPFGLLFLAVLLLVLVFHENDNIPTLPLVVTYTFFLLAFYIPIGNYETSLVGLFVSNFVSIALCTILYLVVGISYTVPKLALHVRRPKVVEELKARINDAKRSTHSRIDQQQIALDFLYAHKWKIYLWTIYWPFNIVHTLCRDPLRLFYEWAWDKFMETYLSIINNALHKIQ